MLENGHDVRASIKACRAAGARGIDYGPCEQGVMMENSLRYAGREDYAASAARGCAPVAGSAHLRDVCFDNLGVVAALSHGHDFERAAAECRQLEGKPARWSCLRGVQGEVAEAGRHG